MVLYIHDRRIAILRWLMGQQENVPYLEREDIREGSTKGRFIGHTELFQTSPFLPIFDVMRMLVFIGLSTFYPIIATSHSVVEHLFYCL